MASIGVILFLAYSPAIHGPLLFDDKALPYGQRELREAPLSVWISGTRPLLMFTYWLNYQFSGSETFGYHVFNLLLHLANGLLVFKLLSVLVPGRYLLCGFGAAIFLLHPLQTESVAYLAGRSELLTAFLLLSAMLLFLRATSTWRWAAAVAGLLGAAVCSKEYALAAVPLFLLLETGWVENPPNLKPVFLERIRLHRRLWLLLAGAGCAGGAFVWHVLSTSTSAGFAVAGRPPVAYFLTECRVILGYLRLFLIPVGQSVDPHPPLSYSLFDHGAGVCLVVILLLIWLCFHFRRRAPLATFGFLSFLIFLSPTSSFVPLLDPMAEHRMYLPLIGLTLVVLEAFARLPVLQTRPVVAMATIIFVCGLLTFDRAHVWSNAKALAEDAASVPPLTNRSFRMLARAYLSENRPKEFLQKVGNASVSDYEDCYLFIDWALILASAGRDAEAVQKLHASPDIDHDAFALGLRGFLEGRLGQSEASLADLNRAIELAPEFDVAYAYRGLWYLSSNRLQAAIADFRRALSMNPLDTIAREGLQEAERLLRVQASSD